MNRLLCLSTLGLVVACADNTSTQPLGQKAQPLTVSVSKRHYLEDFPTDLEVDRHPFQVACGSTLCLAAYTQSYRVVGNFAHGVLVDPVTAQLVRPQRLELGRDHEVVRVAARGDRFFVETTTGEGDSLVHHYQEVDAATESITPISLPPEVEGKEIKEISSTGTSWAFGVVDEGYLDIHVLNPDFSLRGTAEQACNRLSGSLTTGPAQYLCFDSGPFLATRIDEATGSKIDQDPVELTKWLSSRRVRAVYHDGIYLFVTASTLGISTLRMNATTGEVLDLDDDFNEESGFREIYENPSIVSSHPTALAVIDDDPCVFWLYRDGDVRGLRLNAQTGERKEGTNVITTNMIVASAYDFSRPIRQQFELFPLQSGAGAAFVDLGTALSFGGADPSAKILAPSTWWNPAERTFTRFRPAAAYATESNRILVTYSVGDSSVGYGSSYEVRAVLLEATTGEYLGPPLTLGPGIDSKVASDGTNFYVYFRDNQVAHTRRVNADGTLSDLGEASAVNSGSVSAGFNGTVLYASWGSRLKVSNPEGGGFTTTEAMVSDFVLHDETPDPEYRTLLLVRELSDEVHAQRVRAASGTILDAKLVLQNARNPKGASDGTTMFIMAIDTDTDEWKGVLVDPVSGEPINGTLHTLDYLEPSAHVLSVNHDGASYNVLVAVERETRDLVLYRFDTDTLAGLDPEHGTNGQELAADASVSQSAVLAPLETGASLLVTEAGEAERLGSTLYAYYVATTGALWGGDGGGTGGSAGSGGAASTGGAAPETGGSSSASGSTSGVGGNITGSGSTGSGSGDGDGDGDNEPGDGDGDGDGDEEPGDGDGDGDDDDEPGDRDDDDGDDDDGDSDDEPGDSDGDGDDEPGDGDDDDEPGDRDDDDGDNESGDKDESESAQEGGRGCAMAPGPSGSPFSPWLMTLALGLWTRRRSAAR